MKLEEVIRRIDKSDFHSVSIEDLATELGLNYYGWSDKIDQHLKAYYVQKWLCTDTWVGSMLIFLNDEFVAYSYQSARKNDTNYWFASKEAITKLRTFILELIGDQDMREPELVDYDHEFPEFFRVGYANAIIGRKAFLDDGTEVEIVNEGWRGYGVDDVLIKLPASGAQKRIPCVDLKFRIGINDS